MDIKSLSEDEPFAGFRKAWEASRSGQAIPKRCQISLRGFARYVPDLIVLEQCGVRDYRYCQAGEDVRYRLSMKEPGVNFFDFLVPDIQAVSEAWWGHMLHTPCGGVISYSIEYPTGILRHAATMLLPVAKKDDVPNKLVGLTAVLQERYTEAPGGETVIGKYLAEGFHLDVGFGVPKEFSSGYLHAPNPDFMSS